jgi:hypothetical protein
MSSYLHDLAEVAGQLGFTFVGRDGNGHIRLRHTATGELCSAPFTPSDRRGWANTIARLERLSGRKLPRQNNGKYRHRKQPRLDTTLTFAEKRASRQVAALLAEAASVRRRIDYLAAKPTRDAADETRRAITKYEHLRQRLEQLHRIIDPIEAPHHE